jgi:hypothetical protein
MTGKGRHRPTPDSYICLNWYRKAVTIKTAATVETGQGDDISQSEGMGRGMHHSTSWHQVPVTRTVPKNLSDVTLIWGGG